MATKWKQHKQALVDIGKRMASHGLVDGTSGNASLRLSVLESPSTFIITPMGASCESLTTNDMAVLDFQFVQIEGSRPPSSEMLLHAAVYRTRPDVGAVLHTHPVYSTALAVANMQLPPIIDELVVSVGGTVRVAEYGPPGSKELAQQAIVGLGDCNAVLLRHHGLLAVGKDIDHALTISLAVERAAHVYILASLLGKPNELPPEIVVQQQALFHTYNIHDASSLD